MGTLALIPANLPTIVILPAKDAELIDEVVGGALRREAGSSARPRSGHESNQPQITRFSLDEERQRHDSAVSILVDSASPSPSHVWQFLDSLGSSLNRPADVDSALRGLLLLDGFLRTCSKETFQETVKTIINPSAKNSSDAGKPQLDLLKLTLPGSFQFAQPQRMDATSAHQFEGASNGVRAYAKLLLQRLASSRFVFLPVNKRQGGGLGKTYWAQLGAADVMSQLQALQRLQEGVVTCGCACATWLKQVQEMLGKQDKAQGIAPWLSSSAMGMRIVLEMLLKESFSLFSAINYGLMELIERIGRVPKDQGMQALQVLRVSDSQGKSLSELYLLLGSIGVGQDVDFPSVAVMGDGYIASLEQYVGDGDCQPGTPRTGSHSATVLFDPRARDAPSSSEPQPPPPPQQQQQQQPPQVTYVQVAAAHQFEATSQALFGRYAPPPSSPFLALPAPPMQGNPQAGYPQQVHSTHAQATQIVPFNASSVKAAWEVALDGALGGGQDAGAQQQSLLQMAPATQFAGGFDQLLLDSMYETAQAQRRASEAAAKAQLAPLGASPGHDPFAASATVAAPPYVQMAMRAQQQVAIEMQRKLLERHASISSAWNTYGHGVRYGGNAMVPF